MDWGEIAKNFGFPALCLVALAAAVWRVLWWVGQNVVLPLVQRQIKFIDDLTTALKNIGSALETMGASQARVMDDIRRILSRVDGDESKKGGPP